MKLPSISYVVARSNPGNIIGCDNKLPWRLKNDLRRFKQITAGHAIIMGRKTFESIGRPLPSRNNIIVSKQKKLINDYSPWSADDTSVWWANSREEALFAADIFSILRENIDLFVIGGAEIYKIFGDLFNKIYLTEVFSEKIEGDAYFDERFDKRKWKLESELDFPASDDDEFPSRLSIFQRRLKHVRQREISDFMVGSGEEDEFRLRKLEKFEKLLAAKGHDEQFEIEFIDH